jgi:hypothetical protein
MEGLISLKKSMKHLPCYEKYLLLLVCFIFFIHRKDKSRCFILKNGKIILKTNRGFSPWNASW